MIAAAIAVTALAQTALLFFVFRASHLERAKLQAALFHAVGEHDLAREVRNPYPPRTVKKSEDRDAEPPGEFSALDPFASPSEPPDPPRRPKVLRPLGL